MRYFLDNNRRIGELNSVERIGDHKKFKFLLNKSIKTFKLYICI